MPLTLEEWIIKTQTKLDALNSTLKPKRIEADKTREHWRTLEEECRNLEQKSAELTAAIAEAKT